MEMCPVCREPAHPEVEALFGVKIRPCPNMPPEHVYIDAEYEHGPRGAMFDLRSFADQP